MSKRKKIRERQRKTKQQRKMITLGLIIIGAGLIAAVLIYPSTQFNTQFNTRYMANDNAMGNPDAPIKIVEYSDYKCGHCGAFAYKTESLLVDAYVKTDQVYFVSRSVGMMLRSTESVLATEASYCAGNQNKYWEMHDLVFANQTIPFSEAQLKKWAKTIGLDMDAYESCMDNNTYAERVNQDEADAKAEGVEGTPTFIITYKVNGEEVKKILPGDYPFEAFQQMLDEALTKIKG